MHFYRQRLPILLLLLLIFSTALWLGSVSAQENPDDETIEVGARLYSENCSVCHGVDGNGRVGANLDKNWPSIRPDLRVRSVIANGIPGSFMPAWSTENGGPLNETEIDALTTYILSWQTDGPEVIYPTPTAMVREPIEAPPGITGDPNRGAVLFDQDCAVCHGQDGQGRVGATIAKDWPSVRPDLRVKSTVERGVAGTVMPGWSQDFGGPLSDDEIDDLVAYILTLSPQSSAPTLAATSTATSAPAEVQFSAQQIIVLIFILLVIIVIGAAIYFVYKKGS